MAIRRLHDGLLTSHASSYLAGCIYSPGGVPDTSDTPVNPGTPGDLGPLCFTAQEANSTVKLARQGDSYPQFSISLDYSTDGTTWSTYVVGSTITLANIGDKVWFKGDNATFSPPGLSNVYSPEDCYYYFQMSGKIAGSGNIMSLVDSTCESTTLNKSFVRLFYGCTSLTSAPALPATTLALGCYYNMFAGCTSLTSAPALPATTLAGYCYAGMFAGCTSLTSAPVLPATTLAWECYYNMFAGCTSLTAAPALPATTLAKECYDGMFYGCTSLTSAPSLPATTLTEGCYAGMFYGCTSLASAPSLPATTLTERCYAGMFYGCTSLASMTVSFASWDGIHCTADWLWGVASSGTFYYDDASLDVTQRNSSRIPVGWNVEHVSYQYDLYSISNGQLTLEQSDVDPADYPMVNVGTSRLADDFDPADGFSAVAYSPDGGQTLALGSLHFRAETGGTFCLLDASSGWSFVSDCYAIKEGALYHVNSAGTLARVGSSTGWTRVSCPFTAWRTKRYYGLCDGQIYELNGQSATLFTDPENTSGMFEEIAPTIPENDNENQLPIFMDGSGLTYMFDIDSHNTPHLKRLDNDTLPGSYSLVQMKAVAGCAFNLAPLPENHDSSHPTGVFVTTTAYAIGLDGHMYCFDYHGWLDMGISIVPGDRFVEFVSGNRLLKLRRVTVQS